MIEESDEEEEEDGGAAAGGSTRVMIEEDSEEEAPTRAVAVGSFTRVTVEEEDEEAGEREQPSVSSTRLTIEEGESEEEDVKANVTSVSSQPPSSVQGESVHKAESHKSSSVSEKAAEGGREEKKKVEEEGEVTPSVIGEETAAEIRSKMKCPPLPQTAYEFECHIEAVAKSLPVAVEYLKVRETQAESSSHP